MGALLKRIPGDEVGGGRRAGKGRRGEALRVDAKEEEGRERGGAQVLIHTAESFPSLCKQVSGSVRLRVWSQRREKLPRAKRKEQAMLQGAKRILCWWIVGGCTKKLNQNRCAANVCLSSLQTLGWRSLGILGNETFEREVGAL